MVIKWKRYCMDPKLTIVLNFQSQCEGSKLEKLYKTSCWLTLNAIHLTDNNRMFRDPKIADIRWNGACSRQNHREVVCTLIAWKKASKFCWFKQLLDIIRRLVSYSWWRSQLIFAVWWPIVKTFNMHSSNHYAEVTVPGHHCTMEDQQQHWLMFRIARDFNKRKLSDTNSANQEPTAWTTKHL